MQLLCSHTHGSYKLSREWIHDSRLTCKSDEAALSLREFASSSYLKQAARRFALPMHTPAVSEMKDKRQVSGIRQNNVCIVRGIEGSLITSRPDMILIFIFPSLPLGSRPFQR